MRSNGDRGDRGIVPDFDTALWGYDRRQVRRCLGDLTARLEDALSKLDSVEVLQAQLCATQVELQQLRTATREDPPLADQLSRIMLTAERLRRQAEQDAAAIRAGARGEPLATVSSGE